MFGLYDVVLFLRVATAASLPALQSPFSADLCRVSSSWHHRDAIGWTFGFHDDNDRLTLALRQAELGLRAMAAPILSPVPQPARLSGNGAHELERARRNTNPCCLLIFDMIFQGIQRHLRHQAGDEILCKIVSACRLTCAPSICWRAGVVTSSSSCYRYRSTRRADRCRETSSRRGGIKPANGCRAGSHTISVAAASGSPERTRRILRNAIMPLSGQERGRNCVVV